MYEVSCGLAFLHSRSTIHGDLKAVGDVLSLNVFTRAHWRVNLQTNVLIKADETAVITDFGLSRIKFKLDVSSKSTTALVYGTRRWMSPERMRGEQLSPPVDVYAWAMTAYEACSVVLRVYHLADASFRSSQDWSRLVLPMKVALKTLF